METRTPARSSFGFQLQDYWHPAADARKPAALDLVGGNGRQPVAGDHAILPGTVANPGTKKTATGASGLRNAQDRCMGRKATKPVTFYAQALRRINTLRLI